jgi:O-acetyl-ADP-ribose deacetylase (regulator of RNase III)
MAVDAIVNTANPRAVIGLGTDSMIHEAAGPELLRSRQEIGHIDMGQAAITPAFNLQAKCVIHTVGPVWDGGSYGEEEYLRSCYENSLRLALENNCHSIAFPLISTGNYGFPKDKALQIAISAFSTFLLKHEMQIYLVVFDRTSFMLSEKLFQSVASYIDQHYVDACTFAVYGAVEERRSKIRRRRDMEVCESR